MASVFLSYATVDRGIVDKIRTDLESKNHSTWMDHCKIRGGQEWEKEITTNLAKCEIFLVSITEASNNSKWVQRETILAENLQKRRIPLLLGSHIPFRLLDVQFIDFRTSYEAGISNLFDVLESMQAPSDAGHGSIVISSSENGTPDEEPSHSFGSTITNFIMRRWLKQKNTAEVHKVKMPSKAKLSRRRQERRPRKAQQVPTQISVPATGERAQHGEEGTDGNVSPQTIKQLLFCVPHGWLENSTPTKAQVEDKKFVCAARADLSRGQGETDETKYTQSVRNFFEHLLDHMDSTGRQFRSRITVEPTGTIVLRLRVNNEEVGLDFAPNNKNYELLLECVDSLILDLFGNNSGRVFRGGTWAGSLCVLIRAPESSIEFVVNRWKEIGSDEIVLGDRFSLLGISSVFAAGVRAEDGQAPLDWGSMEEGSFSVRDDRGRLCSTLDEVLDEYQLAGADDFCEYNAHSDQGEFVACTLDDEDGFFFLIPGDRHSLDYFLSEDSGCWSPVEQERKSRKTGYIRRVFFE